MVIRYPWERFSIIKRYGSVTSKNISRYRQGKKEWHPIPVIPRKSLYTNGTVFLSGFALSLSSSNYISSTSVDADASSEDRQSHQCQIWGHAFLWRSTLQLPRSISLRSDMPTYTPRPYARCMASRLTSPCKEIVVMNLQLYSTQFRGCSDITKA